MSLNVVRNYERNRQTGICVDITESIVVNLKCLKNMACENSEMGSHKRKIPRLSWSRDTETAMTSRSLQITDCEDKNGEHWYVCTYKVSHIINYVYS